jgi:Raf kinase inhibitor-like YbhB/YbcL family protein
MALSLTSPAFTSNGAIPKHYTCEGEDVSPPLNWSQAPPGTQSFALIIDDPDAPDPRAPKMTWVHWLIHNLPAATQGLPEAASRRGLPGGAVQGINDWKRGDYGGPCPPIGRHRYFHKLYALDTTLSGLDRPTKAELLAAMQGHVLAQAELVGTYQKGS